MKKCKYWRFYKGLRPPQCGCETCEKKWAYEQKRRKEKLKEEIRDDCPDPELCIDGCVGYCSDQEDLTEDVVDYISKRHL